jgi:hypothetical protein
MALNRKQTKKMVSKALGKPAKKSEYQKKMAATLPSPRKKKRGTLKKITRNIKKLFSKPKKGKSVYGSNKSGKKVKLKF